ncbi:MAG: class I SAM-dependent methyltransferase [Acidobacteriales bacterium]|nr:class I SAM-dependent methyltransferase [Terriglobales bacterium]
METTQRAYLPAAGHDIFLPLYDPFVKLLGGDKARRTLLDQARIAAGDWVLDIGCGTGTMVLLIKRLYPAVEVIGLDPDPKALARARRKAERAQASIQLDQGFSTGLPYADASFDRVLSSFMLHHVPADQKLGTLGEVLRVLKPGGSFHMLDFSKPPSNGVGFFARWAHSSHHLAENTEDSILGMMRQAGFRNPETVHRGKMMLFLQTAYFRGFSN